MSDFSNLLNREQGRYGWFSADLATLEPFQLGLGQADVIEGIRWAANARCRVGLADNSIGGHEPWAARNDGFFLRIIAQKNPWEWKHFEKIENVETARLYELDFGEGGIFGIFSYWGIDENVESQGQIDIFMSKYDFDIFRDTLKIYGKDVFYRGNLRCVSTNSGISKAVAVITDYSLGPIHDEDS